MTDYWGDWRPSIAGQWRSMPEFPGYELVFDGFDADERPIGRVRSLDRQITQGSRHRRPVARRHTGVMLSPYTLRSGAQQVVLHRDGRRSSKRIDALIAEHFGIATPECILHVLREWPPDPCAGGCGTDLQPPAAVTSATQAYMVRDAVWAAAGLKRDAGSFCTDCLEQRLGRPLVGADFGPDIPLNHPGFCDDTPRLAKLKADAAQRRSA